MADKILQFFKNNSIQTAYFKSQNQTHITKLLNHIVLAKIKIFRSYYE